MPPDDLGKKALVPEMVEPPVLAVPLPGREYKRQIARMPGVEETPLDGAQQRVRHANSHETRGGKRVTVLDQGHAVLG